jgi:hypothetical protein
MVFKVGKKEITPTGGVQTKVSLVKKFWGR